MLIRDSLDSVKGNKMSSGLCCLAIIVTFAVDGQPITGAKKSRFLKLLGELPFTGEFFSEKDVDKLEKSLPVLLALTERDTKGFDIYRLLALSRGLCNKKQNRQIVAKKFNSIMHPKIRLFWAAMLYEHKAANMTIVNYLRKALDSKNDAALLKRMLGPKYDQFRNRILKHARLPS